MPLVIANQVSNTPQQVFFLNYGATVSDLQSVIFCNYTNVLNLHQHTRIYIGMGTHFHKACVSYLTGLVL